MQRIRLNLTRESDQLCVEVEGGERQYSPFPFFDENLSKLYAIIKILDNDSLDVLNDEQRKLMIKEEIWTDKDDISTLEHKKVVKKIGKFFFDSLFFGKTRDKLLLERDHGPLHIQICYEYSELENSKVSLYPWHLACSHEEITNKAYFSYLVKHTERSRKLECKSNVKLVLIASDASDNSANGDISPQNFKEAIDTSIPALHRDRTIEFSEVYKIEEDKPSLQKLRDFINTHYANVSSNHALAINFYGHGVFKKICTTSSCSHPKCDVYDSNCSECGHELGDPQGYLLFQKEKGSAVKYVSSEEFATIISSGEPKPILTVIMACYSARAYKSENVYAGIAQNLIRHGVSVVVAFPFRISVESASIFIKNFYSSLFAPNSSIFKAFQKGCDACENEWYRPVLFVREEVDDEGRLFDFSMNPPHEPIVKPKHSPLYSSDVVLRYLDEIRNSSTFNKNNRKIIEAYANSFAFFNELNNTMLLFREIGSAKKIKDQYVKQIFSWRSSFTKIPSMKPIPDWFEKLDCANEVTDSEISAYVATYEEIANFLKQEDKRVEKYYHPLDDEFIKIVTELTGKTQIVNFWDSLIDNQLIRSPAIAETKLAFVIDRINASRVDES